MTRPARAIIDLGAARHNLNRVRQLAPGRRILAVIKADAYGHGVTRMARAFADSDAFAVASLEEAVQLRDAGETRPVVLLEGPFEATELPLIERHQFEVVVHTDEQVDMLSRAGRPLPVWVKLDTGMHRLGFAPERVRNVVDAVQGFARPLRFMTHFANAHRRDDPSVGEQIRLFEAALGDIAGERSLANSAAILAEPAAHADWVRPGLMLYGVSPLDDAFARAHDLRPVMSLCSSLIAVRRVRAGETVGYGSAYVCPEDMPVGVVAHGYADGYPRHPGAGAPILVNGVRTQVIGHCSMDMMTVDLRPVPDAGFGDPVTLWGEELPVEEVARSLHTIPYELLCRVRMRAHYEERDG